MKFWFFLFLVAACGNSQPAGSGLSLEVHLPGALSRTEGRRLRFEQRVTHLELRVQSKTFHEIFTYPPSKWDRLELAELGFPENPEDRLKIQARIWDVQRDGTSRAFPALSGSVSIRAEEMARQGPTVLPLRLTLRVPVSDYD